MSDKIRVTILDDHRSIVDGYLYRLKELPKIKVVATLAFGEELEPTLVKHPTDVLLLDVSVPTASTNPNPYPILYAIPKLLQLHPELNVLVISMHAERGLIRAVMEAGASGYILKDDQKAAQDLGSTVLSVANGGIYFSQRAHQIYAKSQSGNDGEILTPRQLEALSLCAAYPDDTSAKLAERLSIAHSTFRNLLSSGYVKLDVHTRTAAIAKARQLGLITPDTPPIHS